jgi:hypothetical protein
MTTQGILIRKEVLTHERMPDGSIRVTKTIDRKISGNTDRMNSSQEVEILK